MSIYATAVCLDGGEEPAPVAYRGSHILPSPDDERSGVLLLCEIPGFITHGERRLCGPDDECPKPADVCCDRVWPWLRLFATSEEEPMPGHATVLLDVDQVRTVHAYLGRWLERAGPESEGKEAPDGSG